MVKIRSKNLKPRIATDFKRKTAKVGRKVQQGNVTKINVQSKHIHIPLQTLITRKNAENDEELMEKLLKQLSHYSGSFRETALDEIKQFMITSENASFYVAIMVPTAMELLYDEERDTRKALLSLMTVVLTKFSSDTFLPIAPLMVTYLSSGLSSLHKGVRRDSLIMLQSIAEIHPQILAKFIDKLIDLVLSILADPSHAAGQDALGSATATPSQASTRPIKNGAPDAIEIQKKSNLLVIALKCLSALFAPSSASIDVVDSEGATGSQENAENAHLTVQLQRSKKRVNNYLELCRPGFSSSAPSSAEAGAAGARSILIGSAAASAASQTAQPVSHVPGVSLSAASVVSQQAAGALCRRLRSVWEGLVLDSPIIASHVVAVLQEIANISVSLGNSVVVAHLAEFKGLITSMFALFPHASFEASLAAPGSRQESTMKSTVELLDLTLCDIALTAASFVGHGVASEQLSEKPKRGNKHVSASSSIVAIRYLLANLDQLVTHTEARSDEKEMVVETPGPASTKGATASQNKRVDAKKNKKAPVAAPVEMDLETSDGEGDDVDASENESDGEADEAAHSTVSLVEGDRLSRLFRCVTRMTAQLDLTTTSNSTTSAAEVNDQSRFLLQSLELMKRLVASMLQRVSVGSATESALPIAHLVKPALGAICSIAIDSTSLWAGTSTAERTAATALIDALSTTSRLLSLLPWARDLLAPSLVLATLTAVRSLPQPTLDCDGDDDEEREQEEQSASTAALCDCVLDFFTCAKLLTKTANKANTTTKQHASLATSSEQTERDGLFLSAAPSSRLRLLMLDAFMHAPFVNALAAAQTVAVALSSSSVTVDEQRYFLRLVFERRREMDVAAFVRLLCGMVRAWIVSAKLFSSHKDGGHGGFAIGTALGDRHTLASAVGEVLSWCASTQTPIKMVLFVRSHLEKVVDLTQLCCTASHAAVTTTAKPASGAAVSVGVERWPGSDGRAFAAACGVVAVYSRLLRPWGCGEASSSSEQDQDLVTNHSFVSFAATEACAGLSTADRDSLETVSAMLASLIARQAACNASFATGIAGASVNMQRSAKTSSSVEAESSLLRRLLLLPFHGALRFQLPSVSASGGEDEFPVFLHFLQECSASSRANWSTASGSVSSFTVVGRNHSVCLLHMLKAILQAEPLRCLVWRHAKDISATIHAMTVDATGTSSGAMGPHASKDMRAVVAGLCKSILEIIEL